MSIVGALGRGVRAVSMTNKMVRFAGSSSSPNVAEPPNLMPPRSARLLLDTKHSGEDTKLHGSIEHTPKGEPKNPHFPSGSQMRE